MGGKSWRPTVACIVTAALGACGYEAIEGDPIGGRVKLPDRTQGDAGADAESEPDASLGPTDAGTDAKPPSLTCTVSGLVLCFRFEGTLADESPSPIAPALATGVTFVDGKEERAALFDAVSAVRFAPNPAFDLPEGAATIEAWIKRENAGADAVVFDDDGRFSLTINAAGNVWCKSSGGAVTGTTVVPVNEWVHVACVIDAGTMTAYVNGVADATGAGAVVANPELAAALGGNSPDGEPFLGAIDSFRLFRTARTAAELAATAAEK